MGDLAKLTKTEWVRKTKCAGFYDWEEEGNHSISTSPHQSAVSLQH